MITECQSCGQTIKSMMALTCSGCGAELRPATLFGTDIRRKPERHVLLDGMGIRGDNERASS